MKQQLVSKKVGKEAIPFWEWEGWPKLAALIVTGE